MTKQALALCVVLCALTTEPGWSEGNIAAQALGDSTSDLVYTTLARPCRILDTRLAGGPLTSSRDFRVAGASSLAFQGGDPFGCNIPYGPATAAMINFVAVSPTGAGNLRASAYPNAIPATGSIINYQQLSPSLNVANGLVFPICDPSTTAQCSTGLDITVQPNGASTHLVADVLGYFSSYAVGTSSLAYTVLAPCRIIDTRTGGGALSAANPRDFKVAGDAGFEAQGGTLGGCGVPSGARVAMINFVAVNPQGPGNLRGSAFPNPIPTTGSVINYQSLSPGLNVANGLLFPICHPGTAVCSSDITLQPNGAGVDVVADVMGYFATAGEHQIPPHSQQNLTYTTFQQPCRIIDTRAAGGILSTTARDFRVTGSGLTGQGGNPLGCGVPSDATAAMINFVAVAAQGAGNLRGTAYPNAIPARGNVINYQSLNPQLNIANGLLFPICDAAVSTCTNDIRLQVNGADVHVVADVMGYAKRSLPIEEKIHLVPEAATISPGETITFTLTRGLLPSPTPVALTVTPSNAGTLPLTVVIPANTPSSAFQYIDMRTTTAATITAYYYGSSVSQAYVHVDVPPLVINEVDYDQPGLDTAEFIEIFNLSETPVDLTNKQVHLVNGSGNVVYDSIDLGPAGTLAPGGFLVIGGPNVTIPGTATKLDPGWTSDKVQNGAPDGIVLVDNALQKVLDAFSYEGEITQVTLPGFAFPVTLVEGSALPADVADTNSDLSRSLCRRPNGIDTDNASADWEACGPITPGASNP